MSTFDTITTVTHHNRPASDYEVQCALAAFGFESAGHYTDVLSGRRPSALAEPSIWRDKAKAAESRTPPGLEIGARVRCWNSIHARHETGMFERMAVDGRVLVRRDADGALCRFLLVNVEALGGAR